MQKRIQCLGDVQSQDEFGVIEREIEELPIAIMQTAIHNVHMHEFFYSQTTPWLDIR